MKTQEKYLQLQYKSYFTTPTSYELSNLHPLDSTQTTLLLKSSQKHLCFANDISPSGSVVFSPLSLQQRLQFPVPENNKTQQLFKFQRPVSDICWNSCNMSNIWAVSEDVRIHIINPEDTTGKQVGEFILDKKINCLEFNPAVQQVLAFGAIDNSLRAIDIEKEKDNINLGLTGRATSIQWRPDGGSIVAAQQNGSKKQFIMVDIRQGQGLELEMKGTKSITKLAVCWIANDELLTIVNEAEQERRMILWDARKMEQPVFEEVIDTNPGQTTPFYDIDTKLLYLTSKGQKSVLVYEYLNHEFLHLNFSNGAKQYEGSLPGVGYCLLPKSQLDKSGEEFNRMLIMQVKQNKEKIVTEVSFKQKKFNYEPSQSATALCISKEEWYNGKQANPLQQQSQQISAQQQQQKPAPEIEPKQQQEEQKIVIQNKPEQNIIQQPKSESQEDLKQEVNALKSEVGELKSLISHLTHTVDHLKQKFEILTTKQ